jgi:hypothetical protein
MKNYSLYALLKDYNNLQFKENYRYDETDYYEQVYVDKDSLMVILLLVLTLWVYSIYVLWQNWQQLHPWAQVVGVLGCASMHPLGSLVTVLVVNFGKKPVA